MLLRYVFTVNCIKLLSDVSPRIANCVNGNGKSVHNGKLLIPLTEMEKKYENRNKRKLINLDMSVFISVVFPFHVM